MDVGLDSFSLSVTLANKSMVVGDWLFYKTISNETKFFFQALIVAIH